MANQFVYTTAIDKLRQLKKRIRVVPGGTSAGKTFGILPILIDRAASEEGLEISVVSSSIPHLRKGALKDFLKIMKSTGRYIDKNYNRTLLTYTFSNGSYIEFFSVDQEDKVRGPRRNILYVNEANNIEFETYHQLAIRSSGEIWLDFNPSAEFWVHDELKPDYRTEWLTLTYLDNEALPESIIEEIESVLHKAYHDPKKFLKSTATPKEEDIKSQHWHNWWQVYGLGLTGSLEGCIFSDWIEEDFPVHLPVLFGQDYGQNPDPTTLIKVALDQKAKRFYVKSLYSGNNLSIDQIYELNITHTGKQGLIIADNNTLIALSLREKGLNIINAKKGPGSILAGIKGLQGYTLVVDPSSHDYKKELNNYIWLDKRSGVPIDKWNHHIDPTRYTYQFLMQTASAQTVSR